MLLLAIMALVQDTPAAAPTPAPVKGVKDPNKIKCIDQLKTGSRTNFIQICHTNAEWALLKSENRRIVERGQANRGRINTD